MLGTALTTTLSLVDMAFISRLGTVHVAGVSAASSVLRFVGGLGGGFATALLAVTARFVGADRSEALGEIAYNGIGLSLLVGLAVYSVLVPFSTALLRLFSTQEELVAGATIYLRLMLAGMVFQFAYLSIAAFFQGCGDTRTPLRLMVLANIVNVALDPPLIFGWGPLPHLGTAGAGLASALSQFTACLLGLVVLRRRFTPAQRGSRNVRGGLIVNLFSLALPAAGQLMTRPLSGMVLLAMVSRFGTPALAAFGIGLRLTSICAVFMNGLGAAVSILVGQALGKKQLPGARNVVKSGMAMGTVVFLFLGLAYFLLAGQLMAFFRPDADVLVAGVRYLKILSGSLVLLGIMGALSGAFRGAGDTPALFQTSVLANFPAKLGLAFFLGFYWPARVYGIWMAIGLSIAAETALLYLWYRSNRWHRKRTVVWRNVNAKSEGGTA
jgi:putative MATE family efflux protein